MAEIKEVTLHSGAKLRLNPAPFPDAKALYQAILEEIKPLKIEGTQDLDPQLIKDLFCTGFSSKRIDAALTACMAKALYNDARITDATWEPVEARGDYLQVCYEVAKENIAPFLKSLYAQFEDVVGALRNQTSPK